GTLPTGDFIRDVQINWGDGSAVQDIGAISGSTPLTHVFATAGNYLVTASISDTAGNNSSVSAPGTIIATSLPTVIVTATSVPTVHAATMNVTFQIQITPPTGVGIQSVTVDWGDNGAGGTPGAGDNQSLGSLTGTQSIIHSYRAAGTFTVIVS